MFYLKINFWKDKIFKGKETKKNRGDIERLFSDVAPKVNTPWITEVKYHHSEKLFNVTGLASLVPLKLKEHSIVKYFFADGQMLTKKDKGSVEANERYINFKDNQMRIEDNYYNNKK